MQISINDVKGCVSADFQLTKIALLLGDNGASKSSVIEAISIAASGNVPTKAARKELIRDGASRARVQVGSNSIDLPNDDATTGDGTIKANKFSIYFGDRDGLADEKPAELSVFLQKLLNTEPTQDQLENELVRAKVSKEILAAVWANVERRGWNDSHKFYSERGRDLKSQWHGIAGMTWGSKQSATWTPKEWEPELDGKSESTLQDELVQNRETLEGLIRFEAVSEDEIEKARAEWETLETAQAAREVKKVELAELETELRKLNGQLQSLPRAGVPPKTLSCTKCKSLHVLSNGELIAAPEMPAIADIEKQKSDIKELESQCSIAGQKFAGAEAAYRGADLAVHNAENAHRKYMALVSKPKHEKPDPVLIEKQRGLVQRCENRLQAFKLKAQADLKHCAVTDNQLVIDVLAPDGFRQKHSALAIEKFNSEYLEKYNDIAGFKPIRLEKNLDITFNGRLYRSLSKGEKYKVNALFAVVVAKIKGDSILLFDEAEKLDAPGRNGLYKLCYAVEIPAVIAMTGTRREASQDLATVGLGASYWLSKGVMAPLNAEVAV